MRAAVLVALLAASVPFSPTTGGVACLDDCLAEYGGAGEDYVDCVEDCGVCGNGEEEGDEECDDGNTVGGDCCDPSCRYEPSGSPCEEDDELCTWDACDGEGDCEHEEEPAPDCRPPVETGAALVAVRDVDKDRKDALVWKWRRGAATSKVDFGDPTAGTSYALCLYDASGLLASMGAPAGDVCGGRPCWTASRSGFRYRDLERTPDGATLIDLHRGQRDGRTSITVRARGDNLDLPETGDLESPVWVQLRRSGSPVCWGAQYSFQPKRRRDVRFKDRSDPAPPPVATTTSTTIPITATTTTSPPAASTTTTSTTPGATTTTTNTTPGASTTSTTAPGPTATVEVTVVDVSGAPVEDADVTISYDGGREEFETTSANGVAVFTDQPVGVPAVILAEDLDDRAAELRWPGFQVGVNPIALTVQ